MKNIPAKSCLISSCYNPVISADFTNSTFEAFKSFAETFTYWQNAMNLQASHRTIRGIQMHHKTVNPLRGEHKLMTQEVQYSPTSHCCVTCWRRRPHAGRSRRHKYLTVVFFAVKLRLGGSTALCPSLHYSTSATVSDVTCQVTGIGI